MRQTTQKWEEDMEKERFTGFPSQAQDHRQPPLNLEGLLVRAPLRTFFARFDGDAMAGERIFDGDLLVIERGVSYVEGQIVLAFVDGERVARRLERRGDGYWLCPGSGRYAEIRVTEDVRIFGRVIHSITHHLGIKRLVPSAR